MPNNQINNPFLDLISFSSDNACLNLKINYFNEDHHNGFLPTEIIFYIVYSETILTSQKKKKDKHNYSFLQAKNMKTER